MTHSFSGSTDILMHLLKKRNIAVFRFNLDYFNFYKFKWANDQFEIEDPCGRKFDSKELDIAIFYKGLLVIDGPAQFDTTLEEPKYIKSFLNKVYFSIAMYAAKKNKLRLWLPNEVYFTKTYQMKLAKKYFNVPAFMIHWGVEMPSKRVIVKPLTPRVFEDRSQMYASVVDRRDLDQNYPWFTQDIADGDRDATVLYINGKVHCFQFATKRGKRTDWRVTEGTKNNRWKQWQAGKDFERRVDLFMRKIGLKFGRLDFIIGGKEPQFLEVNPTGQFGWLDDRKFTLHNEVLNAILDKSSTVHI